MPATNDDIMRKLDKIESMLNKISEQEDEELAEEKRIEQDEEKELSEISESAINLEFPNIEDWRRYIWDTCPFRKEQNKKGEIDFFCKKQNSPCRFDGCPLNYKMLPKK